MLKARGSSPGALPGTNAASLRWKAEPARAVAAIGAGLRAFHDALPVADCPFSWSVEDRLADIRRRAALGAIHAERWHAIHRPPQRRAARSPCCHHHRRSIAWWCANGDTCAPNTLVGEDGRPTGPVDLGALGVADRWADLAIATWSTQWNYGPGWELALPRGLWDRTRRHAQPTTIACSNKISALIAGLGVAGKSRGEVGATNARAEIVFTGIRMAPCGRRGSVTPRGA